MRNDEIKGLPRNPTGARKVELRRRAHVKQRALERYGIDLTTAEIEVVTTPSPKGDGFLGHSEQPPS